MNDTQFFENILIKLLTIVDWQETDTAYISAIHSSYRAKFNSYAKLLGIQTYMVLTKEQAQRQFDWVS